MINAYFEYIEGDYHPEETSGVMVSDKDIVTKKIWDREPEPATFSGLVYFLGFNSRKEFEDYEQDGEFSDEVNRARLRIEVVYEKKLHNQSSAGAIFALKSMGWNEKAADTALNGERFTTLRIEITETGPVPAGNEQDVVL